MFGSMNGTIVNVRTWVAALVAAALNLLPAPGSAADGTSPPTATATVIGATTGTTGSTSGTNAPAGPFSTAPTENLYQIASHLSLRHKSVSTVVSVPAGLPITNNVEISVLFGTERLTRNYSRATINRLLFNFDPLDGAKRRENVTITLRDDTPAGPKTYALLWFVDLEPLFDLTISPLGFIALSACDLFSPADPVIRWVDAEGTPRHVELDGDAGRITTGFAGTWREVGVSNGLTAPEPIWHESDPTFPLSFDAPASVGPPVLPGQSHHYSDVEDGGDCDGRFDYDVSLVLRTFLLL
jgi:hypothetical protein